MKEQALLGSVGAQHALAGLIDHTETYGPHIIEELVKSLQNVQIVAELGAGSGRDLQIVRRLHPTAKLIAIESIYASWLEDKADVIEAVNIERDRLPLADEEADLILANQVLEHTKEVFWIFHEISRSLKIGGHFLFGVPNICSLHNRILLPLGVQPTQHKVCSAHVRPFSKADTIKFLNSCFPGGYELVAFRGSQFYPFPKAIARPLANAFPTLAFTIFFMLRKVRNYNGEFAAYPHRAQLETNFWTGQS